MRCTGTRHPPPPTSFLLDKPLTNMDVAQHVEMRTEQANSLPGRIFVTEMLADLVIVDGNDVFAIYATVGKAFYP
jgi:hypothetical protein